MGGDQVTELDGTGTWQHSNIWAGGKLVATYDGKGIHFALSDPLGTKRVQANAAGQADESCTGLPFGNDLGNPTSVPCPQTANALATNDDATEHHFTGKERDSESGNDYFGARYYASSMGRWMSPDARLASAHPQDPQTWNRYAYTDNNPLKYVDPDGQEKLLVVYANQPVLGTRIHHDGSNVGHAFLGLRDTVSGAERRQGFYLGSGLWEGPGEFHNDKDHAWTVRKSFHISDDQYDKLMKKFDYDAKHPGYYDVNKNSCVTWVEDTAAGVGIDLPKTYTTFGGEPALSPADLAQDLRDQGGEVNPTLVQSQNPGSSAAMSAGVQAGSAAADPPPPRIDWNAARERIKQATAW